MVALRWAGRFAARTQRRLVLGYAWQHGRRLEAAFEPAPLDTAELEARVVATLHDIATRELDDPEIVERCRALRGPVAGALRKEASFTGADMIAVGARGAGGALRVLLGSVSRELTACPSQVVAIVPPDLQEPRVGTWPLLVGVDGSDGAARALRWAGDAARRAGSEVVAVHAFTSPVPDPSRAELTSLLHERRDRLEVEWCAPLRTIGVAYEPVLESGDPPAVLRHVADNVRPACGVFGSRGLGTVTSRLLGSVTHHLTRELAWPVVIVPSARDMVIWPPRSQAKP